MLFVSRKSSQSRLVAFVGCERDDPLFHESRVNSSLATSRQHQHRLIIICANGRPLELMLCLKLNGNALIGSDVNNEGESPVSMISAMFSEPIDGAFLRPPSAGSMPAVQHVAGLLSISLEAM